MGQQDEKRHVHAVIALMSDHGWFRMHKAIMLAFGLEGAVMIQYLVSVQAWLLRSGSKWNDGWFYCTVDRIEKEIGVRPQVQVRILNHLSGRIVCPSCEKMVIPDDHGGCPECKHPAVTGWCPSCEKEVTPYDHLKCPDCGRAVRNLKGLPIISVQKKGLPARRHIKINWDLLEEILHNWMEEDTTSDAESGSTGDIEFNPSSHTETDTTGRPETNTTPTKTILRKKEEDKEEDYLRLPSEDRSKPDSSKLKKKPEPFDYKAVEELQRVIATKVKINCRMNKEKEAQHIRLMREHDKVPKEEIRQVIRWYSEHIHDEYAIEAYSAGAFRRKYQENKFVAAMARNGNGHVKLEMTDHLKLVSKVASRYFNEIGFEKPTRVQLDPLLESMGLKPGSVTPDEVWNGKWE
jgi:ribosomal protein S18